MTEEELLAAEKISPQKGWIIYGLEWPDLQDAAIKILAVSCSNAPAERNFSAWAHVMRGRPELDLDRAGKLVYVRTNLRAIRGRLQKTKKSAIEWDYIKRELD